MNDVARTDGVRRSPPCRGCAPSPLSQVPERGHGVGQALFESDSLPPSQLPLGALVRHGPLLALDGGDEFASHGARGSQRLVVDPVEQRRRTWSANRGSMRGAAGTEGSMACMMRVTSKSDGRTSLMMRKRPVAPLSAARICPLTTSRMSTAGKLASGAPIFRAPSMMDSMRSVLGRATGEAGADDPAGQDRHQIEPVFLRQLPGLLFGQGLGAVIGQSEVGAPVLLGGGPAAALHHRHRDGGGGQDDPPHAVACGRKQGRPDAFDAVAHHLVGFGRLAV